MTYHLIRADPAKNITILVLDRIPPEDRLPLAKAIMQDPALKAEQVGFAIPPASANGLWRLEMMGGEFCGNAARSFGLYAAKMQNLQGQLQVSIAISGMDTPVAINLDMQTNWAEAVIPGPRWVSWKPETKPLGSSAPPKGSVEYAGLALPVCALEGITHILAPGIAPQEDAFYAIKAAAEGHGFQASALGVMFFEPSPLPARELVMNPAVYVYASNSLVFESSCGSGSIALGCYLSRDWEEGERRYDIRQPGGVIQARITKVNGEIRSTAIGGTVTLQELQWEPSAH